MLVVAAAAEVVVVVGGGGGGGGCSHRLGVEVRIEGYLGDAADRDYRWSVY